MSDTSSPPPIVIGALTSFIILMNRDRSITLKEYCDGCMGQQSITIIQEELSQLAQLLSICAKVPPHSEDVHE